MRSLVAQLLGALFGSLLSLAIHRWLLPIADTPAEPWIPPPRRRPITASSDELSAMRKGRVLCWIPSKDERGEAIEAVWKTWARHCDELVFTSRRGNPMRNVVALDVPTLDPAGLWNIVAVGWRYIYSERRDEFDWFVKVDDDTYFSADNFKRVVASHKLNPDEPHYLGHTCYHMKIPFNLGAGHAISRGTLAIVGPHLHGPDPKKDVEGFHCERTVSWAEDYEFARCLNLSGVAKVTPSRDLWNRETFLSFKPVDNLKAVPTYAWLPSMASWNTTSWFWKRKPRDVGNGTRCCSSRPVLWHNLKVSDGAVDIMFELEYYLYNVALDPAM